MSRNSKISPRFTQDEYNLIHKASSVGGESMASFCRRAILVQAKKILGEYS